MTKVPNESSGNAGKNQRSVLIAAKPGRMRESLRILLRLVDGLEVIGQADDSRSAVALVAERRPDLVLLDTNLSGEGVLSVLRWTRGDCAGSRYLVLADNDRARQDAQAAGADAVLIKGFHTAELIEMVGNLLSKPIEVDGPESGGEQAIPVLHRPDSQNLR